LSDPTTEAIVFSRYLVGVHPSPEHAARYARACATLFPDPPSAQDASLVAFALRWPWFLGPLDAASALIRPGSLLRRRILVMAAILETTPEHAEKFLPRARSPLGVLWTIAHVGVTSIAQAAVGVPLLALATRARA
jgi:hypothetical protein